MCNFKIVYNDTNRGANYCRNMGIKVSKYDYILPIDSDDMLNTDKDVLKLFCFKTS